MEREFTCENIQGFGAAVKIFQQRNWVSFKKFIRETNKSIGLTVYENEAFSEMGTYTSYVQGKYVGYSPSAINFAFNFQPPLVCSLKTYINKNKVINEAMAQEMVEAFCRPGA